MKVVHCGEYKGRPYRVIAELTRGGRIVSFNAVYFRADGVSSALAIVPEKPVSTSTGPFNAKGRRFIEQFRAFLEDAYNAERSMVH
jgi:hypothetical protein